MTPPAAHRRVAVALRILGTIDLLALIAALAPRWWIVLAHGWCGLGPLPDGPVVGYLYRSASVMYALHGAMLLFVAADVARYWRLIRFLAILAIVHGIVLVGIDAVEQMPGWWRWVEGPGFAATGVILLWLQQGVAVGNTANLRDFTDKAPPVDQWS
jgi:hypothetical protein